MASAAEQLAANLNFGALAKAEELKKRIWFTLGALLVYRPGGRRREWKGRGKREQEVAAQLKSRGMPAASSTLEPRL